MYDCTVTTLTGQFPKYCSCRLCSSLSSKSESDIVETYKLSIWFISSKLNIFLKELYNKMSTMYENYLGTSEGKRSDSKNWTGYYSALYKFTNSNEYTGLVENCIQKVEENHLLIFSKLFDAVSQFLLEKKVSQVTPVSTQSKTFAIDSADIS
jgi:hypothetical protein